MELLIAILMMMGVQATPDSFNNQEFLDKNSNQIKEAQQRANELKVTNDEKSAIVLGGGNG